MFREVARIVRRADGAGQTGQDGASPARAQFRLHPWRCLYRKLRAARCVVEYEGHSARGRGAAAGLSAYDLDALQYADRVATENCALARATLCRYKKKD